MFVTQARSKRNFKGTYEPIIPSAPVKILTKLKFLKKKKNGALSFNKSIIEKSVSFQQNEETIIAYYLIGGKNNI